MRDRDRDRDSYTVTRQERRQTRGHRHTDRPDRETDRQTDRQTKMYPSHGLAGDAVIEYKALLVAKEQRKARQRLQVFVTCLTDVTSPRI